MAGDTFQKFKSSFNRGVTAISVKTSSSLEKVKIKTHIDSINNEIQRTMTAIGQAAYGIWASGSQDFSSLQEQFALVQQKKEEIQKLQEEYNAIDERDSQILGTAGGEEPQTVEPKPDEVVCPKCGASCAATAKFCRKCGQNLQG